MQLPLHFSKYAIPTNLHKSWELSQVSSAERLRTGNTKPPATTSPGAALSMLQDWLTESSKACSPYSPVGHFKDLWRPYRRPTEACVIPVLHSNSSLFTPIFSPPLFLSTRHPKPQDLRSCSRNTHQRQLGRWDPSTGPLALKPKLLSSTRKCWQLKRIQKIVALCMSLTSLQV